MSTLTDCAAAEAVNNPIPRTDERTKAGRSRDIQRPTIHEAAHLGEVTKKTSQKKTARRPRWSGRTEERRTNDGRTMHARRGNDAETRVSTCAVCAPYVRGTRPMCALSAVRRPG